jgi:hypothetical protein
MTAQLVHELELPLLQTLGLERLDAMAAVEVAQAQNWLAKMEIGLLRHPARGCDGHPS